MTVPAVRRFAGPNGFAKAKDSDTDRIDKFLIKPTSVTGRELTLNAGEVLIDITFGLWFVERPCMTFGGELDANDFVEALKFPTVSGVVVEWVMKQSERLGGGYYVGARIAAVTTGRVEQRVWVHWRAEGKAMVNPSLVMDGSL
jgi:hypothetical protein